MFNIVGLGGGGGDLKIKSMQHGVTSANVFSYSTISPTRSIVFIQGGDRYGNRDIYVESFSTTLAETRNPKDRWGGHPQNRRWLVIEFEKGLSVQHIFFRDAYNIVKRYTISPINTSKSFLMVDNVIYNSDNAFPAGNGGTYVLGSNYLELNRRGANSDDLESAHVQIITYD